ncbi:hypothetical protein PZA11_006886 [Diplocarpon coronariae]
MLAKKDMRRPDLSKLRLSSVTPPANSSSPQSHPLPNPRREGSRKQSQRNLGQHVANGGHVHPQQVHRVVGGAIARLGEARWLMQNRASLVLAIQNWLGESAESKRSSSQPAFFSVGMGSEYPSPGSMRDSRLTGAVTVMALVVTYLPMFLPPPPVPGGATGTEAPAAAPL